MRKLALTGSCMLALTVWPDNGHAVQVKVEPIDDHTVQVKVEPAERLQTLERKAKEYERYRAQYEEVQKILDDMLRLLDVDEDKDVPRLYAGYGKLSKLLEEAEDSKKLGRELKQLQEQYNLVLQERETLKDEVELARSEYEKLKEELEKEAESSEALEERVVGLRDTIDRLLLGEFEYYEVKENDTLPGIAADPLVYGDPSRAVWLRQVNEGRVKRLDKLIPGEILVVPRFPKDGSYEF